MADDQKIVWKALADPTRRTILDLLRTKDCTVGELSEHFKEEMSRIGVMKHLKILEKANLVFDENKGREHWYKLNVLPIEEIYNRWIRSYEKIWASSLINLKNLAEKGEKIMEMKFIEIKLVIDISTGRENVFDLLTNNISDWWGKPYVNSTESTKITLEPRIGGLLYESWGVDGGYKWGEVSSIKQNELLEITGSLSMRNAIYGNVSFKLEKIGFNTRIELIHKAYGDLSDDINQKYTNGWKNLIGIRLKKLAEEGIKTGLGYEDNLSNKG